MPYAKPVANRLRARAIAFVAGVAAMLALAGCTGTTSPENPLRQGAIATGMATGDAEPAEFVRQSRPAQAPEFLPVGVTPPARTTPVHNAERLKALEAELDRQRAASQGFARRAAPRPTYDGSRPPRPAPPPASPPQE